MTEYYTTSLGDYLSLMASKEGISKVDLEKRADISNLYTGDYGFIDPASGVEKEFKKMSKDCDAVVDLKRICSRAFFGLVSGYDMQGTGVKLNKQEKGDKE